MRSGCTIFTERFLTKPKWRYGSGFGYEDSTGFSTKTISKILSKTAFSIGTKACQTQNSKIFIGEMTSIRLTLLISEGSSCMIHKTSHLRFCSFLTKMGLSMKRVLQECTRFMMRMCCQAWTMYMDM